METVGQMPLGTGSRTIQRIVPYGHSKIAVIMKEVIIRVDRPCLIAVRRWISLFHGPPDVVDHTHQGNFTELTVPGTRSHGEAERALDGRIDRFSH